MLENLNKQSRFKVYKSIIEGNEASLTIYRELSKKGFEVRLCDTIKECEKLRKLMKSDSVLESIDSIIKERS